MIYRYTGIQMHMYTARWINCVCSSTAFELQIQTWPSLGEYIEYMMCSNVQTIGRAGPELSRTHVTEVAAGQKCWSSLASASRQTCTSATHTSHSKARFVHEHAWLMCLQVRSARACSTATGQYRSNRGRHCRRAYGAGIRGAGCHVVHRIPAAAARPAGLQNAPGARVQRHQRVRA